MSQQDNNITQADNDLQHFLRLAEAQLSHRLRQAEASEPYSSKINSMRMLRELIKEQIPSYEQASQNSRRPARSTR